MKITIEITKADNGYLLQEWEKGQGEDGDLHVATSQDKAANVVRKILAERFPKERSETTDE